ncbi:MAG TPA: SMP-30/gluconolactonase/LRE family protein [Vicinamibacterales bacterium]
MIASTIAVELVVDARAELGEGPVWDDRAGCLYFVDILRARVHRFQPAEGSLRTYEIEQFVGAVALTECGDLVLAVREGFARLDIETGIVRMVATVESRSPDRRMNDGNCDAAGRFWAGTMALDEQSGAGALYRLDPGGSVQTMLAPVSISNGIDWSSDGTRMFFIDSPTQAIDVFDFDLSHGTVANRRRFVSIAPELGVPDGLTLDADEHVWVALWGGGAVHRYAPDGSLDATVRLPVAYPTSCAFGGAGLLDLYVTTAATKLTTAERANQPHAGGLFRCRPGPAGRRPHRFKG